MIDMEAEPQALSAPLVDTKFRLSDLTELVKARLTTLVLLTTVVGFCMGSQGPIDWSLLAMTLLGTALLAGGAAALNQYAERDLDALMERTRDRPLPSGRVRPRSALLGGLLAAGFGIVVLEFGVNRLSAAVGTLTLLTYLLVYTPLKRVTPLNTLVGAVPGALPPMIGWTAARPEVDWPGWSLFALQFFWQVPHFLAIAWLYRVDYGRAGLRMLPVFDPEGRRTAIHAVGYAAALIAVSLGPWWLGLAGGSYAIMAIVAGAGFLFLAQRFARHRGDAEARLLFLGSVLYLPLVLGVMVWNRLG